VISFVVPAHNEELLLERTLAAIRHAAESVGEPHEIVVVDDSSTDRTPEIARSLGAAVISVQVRQMSRARNAGAAAARGDLLVFVDADTVVPPETLAASCRAWRAGAVGGGALVSLDGRLAPWTIVGRRLLDVVMLTLRLAAGCYVFCTPEAFRVIGGFSEQLFALEEIALSRALRTQGRVEIVRARVVSSGRNLAPGSGRRVLRLALSALRQGPNLLRSREGLGYWYGRDRRDSQSGVEP